jgi:hypothetical protein
LIRILYIDEQNVKSSQNRIKRRKDHTNVNEDDESQMRSMLQSGCGNNDADDDDDNDIDDDENNVIGMNEAMLVDKLEKKNAFLRRIKLIIKWLERIAAESDYMKSIRQKLSSFPEKCFNWEYTLHHLKSQKGYNNKRADKAPYFSREYITELV